MESYVPFIHHLKEIALLYKRSGSIQTLNTNGHVFTKGCASETLRMCSNPEVTKFKRGFVPVSCCGFKFMHRSRYEQHLNSLKHKPVFKPKSQIICSKCNELFVTKVSFRNHVKEKHPRSANNFICLICGATFASRQSLCSHVKYLHFKSKLFECSECSYTTLKSSDLEKHELRRHKEPYVNEHKLNYEPIECCGRIYKYPSLLRKHKAHCRLVKTSWKCLMCEEILDTEEALEQHKGEIHHFIGGRYSCMLCDKNFSFNGSLTRHMQRSHIKSNMFECSKCQFSCATKDVLQRHFDSKHLEVSKCFKCHTCGRSFQRKCSLRQHMAIHFKGNFNCDVCYHSFDSSEELENHKGLHRPCQICGLTFKVRRARESHMRWHLEVNKEKKKGRKKKAPSTDEGQEQGLRDTLKEIHENF